MSLPWLVVGEVASGRLTKLSTEVATVARSLADAARVEARGLVVAAEPDAAAKELARYTGGPVVAVAIPELADEVAPQRVASEVVARLDAVGHVLLGASPDGRDVAGIAAALTGRPVLTNATGVSWQEDGVIVEMSVFGGKLRTASTFSDGAGIVTVRPNAVEASPAKAPGEVITEPPGEPRVPTVPVVDRVTETGAQVSLEDARIVVVGGRGVGGESGFRIVEDLADALGGVVGGTRAAVDSGWIPYARQIGQTGKVVKPQLYLALGVSGAIQHKVGMQTAETIVVINRDPDAPVAEFADLLVVGDLFEVGPALVAELRARRGTG
ncbi:MAG: electron transfer flavoprotein subunit alpha/FixB family protein [Chloroflexota bacterium]